MEEDIKEETQTVGTMLKNARLKRGKTIADVAAELCIRKTYISAIEEMNYEQIPPVPYGVGFIRSYAQYLGLNGDRIISSYRQHMIEENEGKKTLKQENMETSKPHFKHIFIGLCGLAALFIAWSVMPVSEQVEEFHDDAANIISEPVIVDSELDEEAMSQIRAEDEKDGEVSDYENQDSSQAEEKQNTDEMSDNTDSVEQPENPDEATAAEPVAENVETPMKIVVTGPTWLELKQDKNILLVGKVYDNGFEYAVPNEKGMRITVGRPHNVKFLVNGEEVPVVSVMKRKNVSLNEFMPQEEQE
ncbi:MAG: DUF4115 domain-containing protein [Alphaproteobacteria bacterium]|nr:DUF4115 domain-containing protein [Alphaproteobacteria bacterium]